MATIADLTVRISAQISEFQKSFNDGAKVVGEFKDKFEKSADSIQKTVDGIANTFSSFGSVIGTIGIAVAGVTAAAGAFTAAFDAVSAVVKSIAGTISDAVTHTANLGDELFSLSQKTGLSVESLSAFKFIAGQTNTSLDSITGAVFKLETNLGSSSKKTVEALKAIGLSASDLKKADPGDAFANIIAKLGEIPNASARAAAGVDIFGKSFKGIAQLSQEDLPALIKQAKELGVVMSTETAVAADRFNDALGVLSAGAEGLKLKFGAQLLPALIAFTETVGTIFTQAFKTAGLGGEKFGEAFDTVVVQIGQGAARLVEVFALMTKAIAEWAASGIARFKDEANAFITFAETVVSAVKLVDIAQNGGQSGGALDAIQKRLEGARSTINSLAETAKTAGSSLSGFAKAIADASSTAGDNFAATYRRIQAEISTSADKMRSSLKAVGDGGAEGAAKGSDAFKSFEKQLGDLTAQIDRASKTGTPLSQMVKLFGDEASKSQQKAQAWGIAVSSSVRTVAGAFNQAALDKTFDKLDDGLLKFGEALAKAQFKKFQTDMHESAVAMVEFANLTKKGQDAIESLGSTLAKKQFEKLAAGIHDSTDAVVIELTNPFREAFSKLGEDLPGIILGAIQGGGSVFAAAAVGVATVFASSFRSQFNEALKAVGGDISQLSTKSKALGLAAVGLETFTSGFALGQGLGKGKGALAGAGAGAAAGLPLAGATGGLSIAVGAGIGALGGFFGGRAADKKAQQQLEENKRALADQFGGLTKLKELAAKLGVNIQAAFDAKKPEQFQKAVDSLNAAIDGQTKRIEGIGQALDGANRRAAAFSAQFRTLVDAKASAKQGGDIDAIVVVSQQIQELAQRTQPEFERLGLFVRDTFAAMVKESGNAFDAFQQLAPSFETLKSGVSDFGLTSTSVIDGLLDSFSLVNDQAFKPLFENLQATGTLFKGLFDAKALSPEGFQAAAADIGQSIQEIVNRGGDIAKALALSQPQLQALYEAQASFGGITDQTTQSILAQAQAQGLVGDQFKSTQDKVLGVLLAIADVFGAKIPDGIRATAAAAEAAGGTITGAFGSAATTAAGAIDGIGGSLRGLKIPAGQAGDDMRRALETQAAEAAKNVSAKLSGSFTGLSAQARNAAADINGQLAGIKAPTLTVGLSVDRKPMDDVLNDPRFRNLKVQAGTIDVSGQVDDASAVIRGSLGGAFSDAAATIDTTIGDALRGLDIPAGAVGDLMRQELTTQAAAAAEDMRTALSNGLGNPFSDIAGQIDPTIGEALRNLTIPAGEAGDGMRLVLQRQALESARAIQESLGGAFSASAGLVDPTLGASMRDLNGVSKTVSDNILGNYTNCWIKSGASIEGELGQKQRDLVPTSSDVSAKIFGNYTNCWTRSGALIDGEIGGKMRGLVTTATSTANDINAQFARLHVPDLTAKVSFDMPDLSGLNVPALANGGIVRKPTLALIGEAGPEAVVPLGRMGESNGRESTLIINIDGRQVAEATVPHIPGVVRRFGLVR